MANHRGLFASRVYDFGAVEGSKRVPVEGSNRALSPATVGRGLESGAVTHDCGVGDPENGGAAELLDSIHFAVRELTRQVAGQLAARGQGARELSLTFRQPNASLVEKAIRCVRSATNQHW